MSLSVGIIGLPNVGKSTLFNTLTQSSVPAENYPFCTVDPNVGVVEVPDERLPKISKVAKSAKTVFPVIEFFDIAGLVKGASKGEGLGNQFLANIREVDLVIHVIRGFSSEKVTHVENSVDPKRDREIIELELALKDLETLQKVLSRLEKEGKSKSADDPIHKKISFFKRLIKEVEEGIPVRAQVQGEEEQEWLAGLGLLTAKPVIYLLNTTDPLPEDDVRKRIGVGEEESVIAMDIKFENDLAGVSESERSELMDLAGLTEPQINKLIRLSYQKLDLISFFTAGEKEARAWTIKRGTKAPQAAAKIHTDFEKNFIFVDVCSWEDFVDFNGWQGVKDNGKLRTEGKDYVIQDGDVCIFKVGKSN